MHKMVKKAKEKFRSKEINFMNGISYTVNPLLTLKIITASSIFGEPQYYRSGAFSQAKIKDGIFRGNELLTEDLLWKGMDGKSTSEIMEEAIDDALEYDFEGTLMWALALRKDFYMRFNPQIIYVRAAVHSKRTEFTEKNPGRFQGIGQEIMARADEPANQFTYWLYKNGKKNKIPSVLKRSWAKRLSSASKYELYKYRNKGLGLIDTIRICHANSEYIDELMQTGTLEIEQNEKTWEALRSSGMSWKDILDQLSLGHMALLRNLRGIFQEIKDKETCIAILEQLKKGVLKGKQFPFRYFAALKAIHEAQDIDFKIHLCDALEECMDIAVSNMPRLSGRTMCLSDNSGSAWETFNSEYGTTKIAEIDNLSSVITAFNSEEGYVGKFGDQLKIYPITKRNGILSQTQEISRDSGKEVGWNTENGIWIFFQKAIAEKEHWDNIFIYSDQQAGHGGLYGINAKEYKDFLAGGTGRYIDVYKLIREYRRVVNPKVNVYSIQTAGYTNMLVPENCYRTSVLYGWTGKELIYADAMSKLWDEAESKN